MKDDLRMEVCRFALRGAGASPGSDSPEPSVGSDVSAAPAGSPRVREFSLPLARGVLADGEAVRLTNAEGQPVPAAFETAACWPDRSVRWLRVRVRLPRLVGERGELILMRAPDVDGARSGDAAANRIGASDRAGAGAAPASELPALPATALWMCDAEGRKRDGDGGPATVGRADALGTVVRVDGGFGADCPVRYRLRWRLDAGSNVLLGELRLRNERAARHTGGCWDLGDPGSWWIRDCVLALSAAPGSAIALFDTDRPDGPGQCFDAGSAVSVYQDSSGGDRWDSPNHLGADGRLTVQIRGYEVRAGDAARGGDGAGGGGAVRAVVARGDRIQPVLGRVADSGQVSAIPAFAPADSGTSAPAGAPSDTPTSERAAEPDTPLHAAVAVADFWQNFPIALRATTDTLEIAFFPAEAASPVELQGGEQKRWTFAVALPGATAADVCAALEAARPLMVDAATVARSGALPGLIGPVTMDAAPNPGASGPGDPAGTDPLLAHYLAYIERIVDAGDGFAARRESIDEYGWRNFGELVADHESVNHTGDEPFVTHYNNQYDFVLGAALHALRSSDERWWRLHLEAARHLADIDVYHTTEDRPAYNGGMFWHTDHYLPAATATHRTYSRRNATGGGYGGGPADEHNYSSGLLAHHWLTGDDDSREAVIGLADWVIAMDDGAHTLWSLVDRGPTGLASKTVSADYHGPGRGAGNSILALLNGWQLTARRPYMDKADELIRRCIHPRDDLAARELDQPEHRWSYLVFLQVLAQYLWLKETLGEFDYMFHYARESLLHYARWVAEHERPYSEQLDKVELPTETWPAQDVRKPHVLQAAARYTDDAGEAARLRERAAFFFERCLADLQAFETCRLTRPLVLLTVFGGWHFWYARLAADPQARPPAQAFVHAHDFGEPEAFVPQSQRARAAVRHGLRTAVSEVRRLVADRVRARRGR